MVFIEEYQLFYRKIGSFLQNNEFHNSLSSSFNQYIVASKPFRKCDLFLSVKGKIQFYKIIDKRQKCMYNYYGEGGDKSE